MFDLDQAMAKWRQQMMASGLKAVVALDELEQHLRDDVEHAIRSGTDVQEAFETAVKRLGEAESLAKEFAKDPFAYGWKVGNLIVMVMAGLSFLFERFLLLDYGNPRPAERIASSFHCTDDSFLSGAIVYRAVPLSHSYAKATSNTVCKRK